MVSLDIGHHGDVRGVLQQRAVGLVGLGDESLATAVVGIGPGRAQIPANSEGRVETALL